MSRADELRALRDAEIQVIELEEALVEAKQTDQEDLTELKQQLRAARQHYRTLRRQAGPMGIASPVPVQATAHVTSPGGDQ